MNDKFYMHSTKEEGYDQFSEIARNNDFTPTQEALRESMRVGYEVCFEGYWTKEGKFFATHVMGVKLQEEAEL